MPMYTKCTLAREDIQKLAKRGFNAMCGKGQIKPKADWRTVDSPKK